MNQPPSAPHRLLAAGGLPAACTVMTGLIALNMALVALGNLTAPGGNAVYVRHVLAMDTTSRDPDIMWRAVTSEHVIDAPRVTHDLAAWGDGQAPHNHSLFTRGPHAAFIRAGKLHVLASDRFEPLAFG